MNTLYNESEHVASENRKWERGNTAELVFEFESKEENVSQRDFAKINGVARSTLRYWSERKKNIDAHPFVIEFFENPVGLAFLHRLVTSAHISFTKSGPASIHNVSDFLERSGLAPFVASSYSSQRRVSGQIDDCIIQFGDIENNRLGQEMPKKIITLSVMR
ncbi:MAG: hypothetical protein R6U68_02185 [Desulfobacteraceae bacterium]